MVAIIYLLGTFIADLLISVILFVACIVLVGVRDIGGDGEIWIHPKDTPLQDGWQCDARRTES
jgi:hypothetical protein